MKRNLQEIDGKQCHSFWDFDWLMDKEFTVKDGKERTKENG